MNDKTKSGAAERMRKMAKDEIASYNQQIKESEPCFPQWAYDVLEILDDAALATVSSEAQPVDESAGVVWKATASNGETCHFGHQGLAQAWARASGKVEPVALRDRDFKLVAASHAPDVRPSELNSPESIDRYARSLAMGIWRDHYIQTSPEFELLDSTYGVMSQIDNMLTGLARKGSTQLVSAQGVSEPVKITPEEMGALKRFEETTLDGEGYDVPKPMMARLAEIGLIRRTKANYYMFTEFGNALLASQPAAPVQPQEPFRECRHCGWECRPNDAQSKRSYPVQAAPSVPDGCVSGIDANDLEKMAKERPDECFLKGSGVLKLIGAIRQLEREARQAAQAAPSVPDIKEMVNLFLGWPLPKTVLPDQCVMNRDYQTRSGTNLLTAVEAKAMFEYCLRYRPQAAPAVPDGLREIGRLLLTQDNRITDAPLFIVQQKRTYVTERDYNDCRYEWRETESGEYIEATPERARRLEAIYQGRYEEPKGWKRFAVFDVWEFVTACFTQQGCKDYLRINGHNLKEPRIYAESSFRNEEYRFVREWLVSIAAQSSQSVSADAEDQMDIDREGARFWHRNCANHLGGVMKVVKDEPTQSLIQCLHCGKSGYYPVGGLGRIRAAIAAQSKEPKGVGE